MSEKQAAVRKTRLTLSRAEAVEYDGFLLSNPVFVKGFALTAAVGGAVSLRNALLLSLAGAVLILTVRLLCEAVCGWVKQRWRTPACVLISALASIPVMVLLTAAFGGDVLIIGLYMPLLFMDSAVLARSWAPGREGRLVLGGAVLSALGFTAAMVLIGTARELLADGSILGRDLFSPVWKSASSVTGGLIVTALFAAVWQMIRAAVMRVMPVGGHEDE